MRLSKIALGTAQLGLNYGIANVSGKPDLESAIELLDYAWESGINVFDTASAYGNSEEIIGSFILNKSKEDLNNLILMSKLPRITDKVNINFDDIYQYIKEQIESSLKKLNLNSIPIYLLHHAPDIYLKDGIILQCLDQIREEGLIEKIGVSTYEPEEAQDCLEFREIDVLQMPINLFDQRFIQSDLLKKLKERDLLLFARSIFLQGLFFIPPNKISEKLNVAIKPISRLWEVSQEYKLSIAELAFLFIRDLSEIDSVLIGAEKVEQISQNLEMLNKNPLSKEVNKILKEEFSGLPKELYKPTLWKK